MDRYPEYKDSGIEWIGEIPSYWEIGRLKHCCEHINIKRQAKKDELKISPEYVESGTGKILHYHSSYENLGVEFKTSDTLLNKLRVYLAKVVFCEFPGLSMGEMIVLRPTKIYPKFQFYLLLSYRFIDYLNSLSEGVKMPRTPIEGIMNSDIPIPIFSEQSQISQFLDKKTTQIDSLIEKIERKIGFLREYRTALVSRCVTKGLEPDVEMKDSGIEWIGEIPKHWNTKRLASLGIFFKGRSITNSDLTVSGNPCILYSQIYTTYDRIATEIEFFIERDLYEKSVKISKGAFLFSCSGETVDEIGKCVLYFDDKEISIGGDIVVFELSSTEQLDSEFLSFVFNSFYCQFFKASNSRGEIIVHIYEKQLREFRVVFPCIEEQIQISKYLNRVTAQIDTLIEKLILKIALQKEYRQSLISNVVTGKVRVTEYEK